MTNFEDLNLILDNLVNYFTGSYLILGLLLCLGYMLVLMAKGLDFRYSTVLTLPLIGLFLAIGWFGAAHWILNLALLVVAFFYALAVLKLTT